MIVKGTEPAGAMYLYDSSDSPALPVLQAGDSRMIRRRGCRSCESGGLAGAPSDRPHRGDSPGAETSA